MIEHTLYEHPDGGRFIATRDGRLAIVDVESVPIGPLGLLEVAQKLIALAELQLEAQIFPAPIRITERIVGWPQTLADVAATTSNGNSYLGLGVAKGDAQAASNTSTNQVRTHQ